MESSVFLTRSTRKEYRFIPFDKFEYVLNLDENTVLQKLSEGIETNPMLTQKNWKTGKFESKKLFEGSIYSNQFIATKVSATRNSFSPVVDGEVIAIHPNKTIIRGTQKLDPIVLVFCSIILLGLFLGGISVIIYSISESKNMTSVFFLLVPLFVYGFILWVFELGKQHTRDFFIQLFPEIKESN